MEYCFKCRRYVTSTKIDHSKREFPQGNCQVIEYCCAECGQTLKVDYIPVKKEQANG